MDWSYSSVFNISIFDISVISIHKYIKNKTHFQRNLSFLKNVKINQIIDCHQDK